MTPSDGPAMTPDLTAAELALGVLEGEERVAALRRVLADPDFAREVARWRDYLAGLYATAPAVEPNARLAELVAAMAEGRRRRSGHWAWAAGGAALAASVAGLLFLARPVPTPVIVQRSGVSLVAVLRPEHGEPFGAVVDLARREVRLTGGVAVPSGRDAELWAIGKDGVPRAVGLLARHGGARLQLAGVEVAPGSTLAVSIEPIGGSPKPGPTGPVVASGLLIPV